MVKRVLSLIALALCLSSLAPPPAVAVSPSFTDIGGHWAEEVIERFSDGGIISGFPDGSFRPNQAVTRAELAAILTRAFDLNEEVPFAFSDVDSEAWYYAYLQFAVRFIPNHQFGESYFYPNANAHRIDVAEAFVLIKLDIEGIAIDMPTYEEIARQVRELFRDTDYHYGDISFPNVQRLFRITWLAHHLGIMEGCPAGYFRPAWGVTRAEVLTIIDRMLP